MANCIQCGVELKEDETCVCSFCWSNMPPMFHLMWRSATRTRTKKLVIESVTKYVLELKADKDLASDEELGRKRLLGL